MDKAAAKSHDKAQEMTWMARNWAQEATRCLEAYLNCLNYAHVPSKLREAILEADKAIHFIERAKGRMADAARFRLDPEDYQGLLRDLGRKAPPNRG